jgi:hypothetical protein
MTIANRAITGVGNYATGGRSKAARNDTYISAYALLSLSLMRTTAVLVESFDATALEDGTVRVEWTLSSDGNDLTTNLYRVVEGRAERSKVNEAPNVGAGSHVLIDTPPSEAGALSYELMEVTSSGERSLKRIAMRRADPTPVRFSIGQNDPNPFSSSTRIRFEVAEATPLRLTVYDASGRLVRVIHDEETPPGRYTTEWNGRGGRGETLPNGVYFVVAEAGGRRAVRRAIRLD